MGTDIGIFGSFFPHYERAGNTTTYLAYLATHNNVVSKVTVYGNLDSKLPHFLSEGILLKKCWKADDPTTLMKTMIQIKRSHHDLVIFNIFPTSFGRKRVANLTGLVIPLMLSLSKRMKVLVYMHNFLETQDFEVLGYHPSNVTRQMIGFLERLLAKRTLLVTTLPSMASKMSNLLNVSVGSLFLPFVEGALALKSSESPILESEVKGRRPTVLLFGAMGPQKNTIGALQTTLQIVGEDGLNISIIVAGHVNVNFPEYQDPLLGSLADYSKKIEVLINIPEEEVASIFARSDGIILPYRSTGGLSGVLNVATFFGLNILAYDNPQLREQAELLDSRVLFINPGDVQTLRIWLRNLEIKSSPRREDLERKALLANHAFNIVLEEVLSRRTKAGG